MGETKYEVKDLGTEDGTKLLYFDCDDIEYATSEEIIAGTLPEDQREDYHAHISRDMRAAAILLSPTLSVVRVKANPGDSVAPHRHGYRQLTFILSGALHYGNRVVGPEMGVFTPDTRYSWKAGPEGADFLEITDAYPSLSIFD